MPYQIAANDLQALGKGLEEYYETAWQEGIKGLFDKMAQSQMGLVTGYLDQANDTFENLRKKSNDKFGILFKPALKQYVGLYLANKSDVASDLVTIGEKALTTLASHIPIPHLGSVVSAAVSFAAGKGRDELHKRSVNEADQQLAAKTGVAAGKFFTTDTQAAQFIQQSIDQYKLICKFCQTLPTAIRSWEDAVTFPGSVFKVQAAASSLNVAIVSIEEYLEGMRERLGQIQKVGADYIATVRKDMPDAANSVLQAGYQGGYGKGEGDIAKNKYAMPGVPQFRRPDKPGAATQLAAYLAHAVAQGYYDSGNRGPQIGRPRAGAISVPPVPAFRR
ncbi:MAG: hypothetical protein ACLPX8_08895 [Bryobacteraceae bacterium]